MKIPLLSSLAGVLAAAAVLAAGLAGQPAEAASVKAKPKASPAAQPPPSKPGIGIETAAKHALVLEVETGTVLLDKGADERIPPASMSKIMTAYVVFDMLKQGRASLEDELPVSERAAAPGVENVCADRRPHQDR
jgi:D-alanyl-D-alanine carboxypeptidase (penicillin-binding protein 5/6)